MNMELKRRGELIESMKSDEAVKKSEETLAAQSKEEVTELRAKVEELQKELSDARKDLEKKSALPDDAQSETMSTSTVSRVEEQSRMADIEASFEDRSDFPRNLDKFCQLFMSQFRSYLKLKSILLSQVRKVETGRPKIEEEDGGARGQNQGATGHCGDWQQWRQQQAARDTDQELCIAANQVRIHFVSGCVILRKATI